MPLANVKFFEEPREYTAEQIKELKAAGLLRDDPPAKAEAPGPALIPATTPAPQPGGKPAQ
jgi:hypothetical protein